MISALNKKHQVNGWVILIVGVALGVLGYFYYQQTYAGGGVLTGDTYYDAICDCFKKLKVPISR